MTDKNLLPNYKNHNLLIISSYWPSKSNTISGVFVVQQVEAFLKLGINVTVLLARPFGKSSVSYLDKHELKMNYDNFRLVISTSIRLPESLSSLKGALELNTLLSGYINKLSIKHITKNNSFFDGCIVHGLRYSGLSVPIWSKQINGRTIVVVHGVDPYLVKHENLLKSRKIIKRTINSVDYFITVGTPLVTHLENLGIEDQSNIQTIANGTEIINSRNINAFQRPIKDTRTILSVSNLIKLKGIDYNLKALAKIYQEYPEVKWEYRVVGDGVEKDALIELSKDLGINHKVVFLGRLTYDQTMEEMSNADIFSLPSWGEAFGIVYLEAMMRMKPVIGCYDNGAADLITDNIDGILIKPKSEESTKTALEKLILDPDLCAKLGRNARERAKEFSWSRNANRMLTILYNR